MTRPRVFPRARPHVRLAVAALAVALAACGTGSGAPTQAELDAVAAEAEQVAEDQDGVVAVSASTDTALPAPAPNFSVEITTEGLDDAGLEQVGRAVLERIWRSDLAEVDTVSVWFLTDASDQPVYLADLLAIDGATFTRPVLEDLLGPRDG